MDFKEYLGGNSTAIVVLHEIYGINRHVETVCQDFFSKGFDVYCPNMLGKDIPFDYTEQEAAYDFFSEKIGFDVFHTIHAKLTLLKKIYARVILLGFSVGATIAWRCAALGSCDLLIGYYGSRIRDYLSETPKCPTLLLFAREDSFRVAEVVEILAKKENVTAEIIDGSHGFADRFSLNYRSDAFEFSRKRVEDFLI